MRRFAPGRSVLVVGGVASARATRVARALWPRPALREQRASEIGERGRKIREGRSMRARAQGMCRTYKQRRMDLKGVTCKRHINQ